MHFVADTTRSCLSGTICPVGENGAMTEAKTACVEKVCFLFAYLKIVLGADFLIGQSSIIGQLPNEANSQSAPV